MTRFEGLQKANRTSRPSRRSAGSLHRVRMDGTLGDEGARRRCCLRTQRAIVRAPAPRRPAPRQCPRRSGLESDRSEEAFFLLQANIDRREKPHVNPSYSASAEAAEGNWIYYLLPPGSYWIGVHDPAWLASGGGNCPPRIPPKRFLPGNPRGGSRRVRRNAPCFLHEPGGVVRAARRPLRRGLGVGRVRSRRAGGAS